MLQKSIYTTDVECLDSSLVSKNALLVLVWLILLIRYLPLWMRTMTAYHNHHGMSKI